MATLFSPGYIIMNVPYDGSPPTLVAEFSKPDPKQPGNPLVVGSDVLYWATHGDRAREHIFHADTGVTHRLPARRQHVLDRRRSQRHVVGPNVYVTSDEIALPVQPPKLQTRPRRSAARSSPT